MLWVASKKPEVTRFGEPTNWYSSSKLKFVIDLDAGGDRGIRGGAGFGKGSRLGYPPLSSRSKNSLTNIQAVSASRGS